jgi:hypothetical protein
VTLLCIFFSSLDFSLHFSTYIFGEDQRSCDGQGGGAQRPILDVN